MSFVGHIFRSNDIGKDLLMGTVYGNRGRDNKTRYSDNIKEIGGGRSFVALCRMAQDRVSWRATAVQFEPTVTMDPELLEKSCSYHGRDLVQNLVTKQGNSILKLINIYAIRHNTNNETDLRRSARERQYQSEVRDFIAKKSHILFRKTSYFPHSLSDYSEECYAIPPPIEHFLTIPESERKEHFLRSLRVQDIVIGVVTGKHETGLYITLLCMHTGKIKDIRGLTIKVIVLLATLKDTLFFG
ncbi:Tetratricopeptide repeat protein 14 [Nymphon striatum]|nr:Tetratricopeptide repeat protein 14 [Nymphon striatum]